MNVDDISVKTSEGVEVSNKGFAICEGKIDKEIAKLRALTTHQLNLMVLPHREFKFKSFSMP